MPSRKQPRKPEPRRMARAWFDASADASAEMVEHWDIKQEHLANAVLRVLALGSAVMFSASRNGLAIGITIFDGDDRQRKWVGNSVELDDHLADLADAAAKALAERGQDEEEG